MMQGNLFDMICDEGMPIDHPMCQECTDKLLDCMDSQLKILDDKCADYKRLADTLRQQHARLDLNSLRMEHAQLQVGKTA